jgi:hypothetical protein
MEKKSIGLLELETAVLECFLEKTPLSPLGVKDLQNLQDPKIRQRFWEFTRKVVVFQVPEHMKKTILSPIIS